MPNNDRTLLNKYFSSTYITIALLCAGYFIDFYDLTIFSTTYTRLIPEQFGITQNLQIQQLYLYITNWATAGSLGGAILWGILGDKLGRSQVIKYSILVYSIANILTIFTHSIVVFCALRFITGAGLTAEFAISSILINELLKTKEANFSNATLYICGILGGICATFLSFSAWQISFAFGGIAGITLYLARQRLIDSSLFMQIREKSISRGNIFNLINTPQKLFKLIKLAVGLFPYQLAITIMFIFPSFMAINMSLSYAVRLILLGFFMGNLVSTYISYHIITYLKNHPKYLIVNIILLGITLNSFSLITHETLLIYAFIIGIFTGGYPVVWMQGITHSFGTNIRSTATNLITTIANSSKLGINLILAYIIATPAHAMLNMQLLIVVLVISTILILLMTQNNYGRDLNYIE